MPIFGRPSRQTALRSKLLHFTRTSERSCRVQRACVWAGVHEKDRARAPRKPRGGRLERARVRAPLQCRMQRHCRREVHGREGPLCAGREAPCAGNRRVRSSWSVERSATAREGPRKYVEALPQRTCGDPVCDHRSVDSQARKQCKKIAWQPHEAA